MIYADNAATTRISDTAFAKMLPFLREQYGNASSQYSLGVKAKKAVEHARHQVAIAIGADASEITFTSSGSEANSWVIRGIAENSITNQYMLSLLPSNIIQFSMPFLLLNEVV